MSDMQLYFANDIKTVKNNNGSTNAPFFSQLVPLLNKTG